MGWNARPVKKRIAGAMPGWKRWHWRGEIGNKLLLVEINKHRAPKLVSLKVTWVMWPISARSIRDVSDLRLEKGSIHRNMTKVVGSFMMQSPSSWECLKEILRGCDFLPS